MEFTHFITLLVAIGGGSLTILGGMFTFYKMTNSRIIRLEDHYREDLKSIDQKFEHLDAKFDQKFDKMDQKFDQKFDRIFELMAFRNPPPQRMHGHKPKGKSA